jgi:hypothetical protein
MRPLNDNIILSQTAATITTAAIPALNLFSCSAQITSTGSGSGTLIIQASNDDPTSPTMPPTNWSPIPSATVTVTGAGAFLIPKTDLCYQYVRLVYTNTGTGTISVVFKALGE